MNDPLLTLPLCMNNPFSWNLCLIYKMGFHKLSGCKLVLHIALAVSDSLLAVDNLSGWGHIRLSILCVHSHLDCSMAADSLRASKTDGCKENSSL